MFLASNRKGPSVNGAPDRLYRGFVIRGLSAIWVVLILMLTSAVASAGGPANVLIFYADDLGWGELGCQGNDEIPTPNIDSIAGNGVRFTSGYVAATYCSPSRAGLLTGRYPTRFGHEFNSVPRVAGLRHDQVTLATRLKRMGHATAAIGKWHLGDGVDYRPTRFGFDEFYGTLGNSGFVRPVNFVDSRLSDDVRAMGPSFYSTEAYGERALDWLEKHKTGPWFLYLPFNAQHVPLEAPQKYLDRFPGIEDENRRLFAAVMSAMDDAVGRVLAKVRAMGQEENTLVFFISDNGGPPGAGATTNGPLRGFKTNTFEGATRVPFLVQWKGVIPAGKVFHHPVTNLDVVPTAIAASGGAIDPAWGLDGVDLVPYLTGAESGRPHETLYWRFGSQWAIRHGDLKLVVSEGGSGEPELYDLAADVGESRDLAPSEPARVKELTAMWEAWNAEQAPPSVPNTTRAQERQQRREAATSGG